MSDLDKIWHVTNESSLLFDPVMGLPVGMILQFLEHLIKKAHWFAIEKSRGKKKDELVVTLAREIGIDVENVNVVSGVPSEKSGRGVPGGIFTEPYGQQAAAFSLPRINLSLDCTARSTWQYLQHHDGLTDAWVLAPLTCSVNILGSFGGSEQCSEVVLGEMLKTVNVQEPLDEWMRWKPILKRFPFRRGAADEDIIVYLTSTRRATNFLERFPVKFFVPGSVEPQMVAGSENALAGASLILALIRCFLCLLSWDFGQIQQGLNLDKG
ncbi:unnamed protein product [Cyprideis torosa]|uniref:Uncharacterized protein n=1 Tax=Cyprideis torosa TaxID=163714 RepID=A0A7R8WE79_9CRUS|nr:unnamed protein product [Cyprideis torosa]CAG0889437.1 unnamed protein product [Cyprideis torosa]